MNLFQTVYLNLMFLWTPSFQCPGRCKWQLFCLEPSVAVEEFLTRQSSALNAEFLKAASAVGCDKKKQALVTKPQQRGQHRRQRSGPAQRPGGGGGAQRAYFHKRIREATEQEKADKSSFFRRLHAEFKALSAEEKNPFTVLGQLASVSHRAGGRSFIHKQKNSRSTKNRALALPCFETADHLAMVARKQAADEAAKQKVQERLLEQQQLQHWRSFGARFHRPLDTGLAPALFLCTGEAPCKSAAE